MSGQNIPDRTLAPNIVQAVSYFDHPRRTLSDDLEAQATTLFVANYVFKSHDGGATFYDFVPEILATAGDESPLRYAVNAVGLANLASRTGSSALMLLSSKEYHLALCRLNEALQSSDTASQDDTLATVSLLGLYEVSWSDNASCSSSIIDACRPDEYLPQDEFRQIMARACPRVCSTARTQRGSPVPD